MYFAAVVQLSGPRSAPSTVTNHSCGRVGGRDGFAEGRAAGPEPAAGSCRLGNSFELGTTAPACTVMTLLQVLQRMRRIRCLTFSSAIE